MKKKIKSSVNILGHDWSIEYVDAKKLPSGACGMAVYPDRKILILVGNGMNALMTKMTLLHECRHGYQFESGMTNVLGPQVMETDADGFASFAMSLKKQGVL